MQIKNHINYIFPISKYKFFYIHFAAFKTPGKSVNKTWEYYYNNLVELLVLIDLMRKHSCKSIIFSSSVAVYEATVQILMNIQKPDQVCNIVILHYFNPIGAHKSGLIGDSPNGIPNNLMPYITKVALGDFKELKVFGGDYDTPDGTGIRDYIHVVDLAAAHVCAIKKLQCNNGLSVYNIGTGKGYSVLENIKTFEQA